MGREAWLEACGMYVGGDKARDECHDMNLFYTRCVEELNISSACLDDLIQHLVIRVTLVLDYTHHPLNYIPLEYLPPHPM